LLALGIVYGTASLSSHLNIGQRHILPLYPILFILAGSLAVRARKISFEMSPAPSGAGCINPVAPRESFDGTQALSGTEGSARTIGHRGVFQAPFLAGIGATLAVIIVGIAVVETGGIRPNYLSFFNQLVGGPKNGWRLLGDSSLDWGQNLPRLQAWLEANRKPNERVCLTQFGADDPFYRGIKATEVSPYYSFGRPLQWGPLGGGLYCIGASMLQDASSPYSGPWTHQREATYQHLRAKIQAGISKGTRSPIFGVGESDDLELWSLDRARFARLCMYLRARSPNAVVGNTIFIYRLSDDEIRNAVDGSLTDLAIAIEAAIQNRSVQP
jgi:hypothetical protein